MHEPRKDITRLTLALNSAARSAPSFFSSAMAAGSLPQIIGAFMIQVDHNQNQKHKSRGDPFQHHIFRRPSEVGLSRYGISVNRICRTYYRFLFDN